MIQLYYRLDALRKCYSTTAGLTKVELATMINQSFLQKFLAVNPTIEQISARAVYLDDRAADHLRIAAVAYADHYSAIAVKHNDIAVDLMDTADALREVVCDAAQHLVTPDWAVEAEQLAEAA